MSFSETVDIHSPGTIDMHAAEFCMLHSITAQQQIQSINPIKPFLISSLVLSLYAFRFAQEAALPQQIM